MHGSMENVIAVNGKEEKCKELANFTGQKI
jgi:hypothetical protein